MKRTANALLSLPLLLLAGACAPARPAAPEPEPDPGLYTEAQAVRGKNEFAGTCAECHYASEFRGSKFQFTWGRRTVGDLYTDIVGNMPEDDPGSLSDQAYVDIVAYILQLNGFPAGRRELPADAAVLGRYGMATPPDAGSSVGALP